MRWRAVRRPARPRTPGRPSGSRQGPAGTLPERPGPHPSGSSSSGPHRSGAPPQGLPQSLPAIRSPADRRPESVPPGASARTRTPSADVAVRRSSSRHPRLASPRRSVFRARRRAPSTPRDRWPPVPDRPVQPHGPSASSAPEYLCRRAGPVRLRTTTVPRRSPRPVAGCRVRCSACQPPGREGTAARPRAGACRPCVSCAPVRRVPGSVPWEPSEPRSRTVSRPLPAAGSHPVAGSRPRPRTPGVAAEACIRPCGAGRVHRWAALRNRAPGWWARWSWARSVLHPQGHRSAGPVQGPRAVAAGGPPALRCGGR